MVRDSEHRRLVNMFGALSVAMADALDEAAEAAADLTEAGPAALVALHETGPHSSINDLRRLVGLTHSGAVRLVDRLVAAGYVERGVGRNDRSVGLKLTRRGAGVALRVHAARHEALAGSLVGLDASDRAHLSRLCEVLLGTLTEQRLRRRDEGDPPLGGALCRLCDFGACGRPAGRCPAAHAAAEHRAERQ